MTDPQDNAAQDPTRRGRRRPRDTDGPGDRGGPGDRDTADVGGDGVGVEGEYVVLPPATAGGRRLVAVGGVVVAAVGVLVLVGVLWATRQMNPSGGAGATVAEVVVPRGSSTDAISRILGDAGVVTSPRMFRWYTSWQKAGPWEAGRYVAFRRNSSFADAVKVLDAGPVAANANTVRITEGKRLNDALAVIARQMPNVTLEQLVGALQSGAVTSKFKPPEVTNWEGFLFPDTYEFAADTPAVEILQTMVTKMDSVLTALGYDKAQALQGRSAYELVTTASLVEREAGAPPDERGKVARVIYNRLDAGEPVGIDAANLYGLGRASGSLTKADLAVDSPYNVRRNKGLPPTPISLPGRASLDAAINPPAGNWKYYVLTSKDPPIHLFTASYTEFQQAKADAQARGVF